MLLVIPDDTTFFCQIREDLKKDLLVIHIQSQLRSHHKVHDFSNDHDKFDFQNGLSYHDGLLYVLNGLHARHGALDACHFGFNKTIKFVF
jgi:hypothetical protein